MMWYEVIFQILLVFAPHIGYVAQYFEITMTHSIEGYAPLVSLILLTSNTLRIYYYFGNQYMLALLFQAIVAVVVHLVLLLKVLEVHVSQVMSERQEDVLFGAGAVSSPTDMNGGLDEGGGKPAPAAVTDAQGRPYNSTLGSSRANEGDIVVSDPNSPTHAPPATTFGAFVNRVLRFLFYVEDAIEKHLLQQTPRKFTFNYATSAAVTLVVVIVYYLSFGILWSAAPEVVGYVSLGIEALLVMPQILRNARRQSTEGLSLILIVTWVGGDIIKVIYFIYAGQALPFILCGIFQIALDVVVVAQVVYYRFYLRRDAAVQAEAAAETAAVSGSREEAANASGEAPSPSKTDFTAM